MLEAFLTHRREVVTRRTIFELKEARRRGHVLEGQAVALANIDPIIELIKAECELGRGERKIGRSRLGAGQRNRNDRACR